MNRTANPTAAAPALAAQACKPEPAAHTAPLTAPQVSWHALAVLVGGASICIGILWDISWHRTIGRDTFWTPAHMAIYFGGLLGGLTCGWLVLRTTFFSTPEEQSGAVRIWGFRGPLGAWITIWGSFAMLTSAPFDNWWHNAYGIDVKILSPPHAVLALGMFATVFGALILVLREQNLGSTDQPAPGRKLFIYAGGILVVMASVFLIEHSWPNQHRTRAFYEMSAATFPLYLVGLSRASKFRWGATLIALAYMLVLWLMNTILPLFPGQVRLGPIYNPVTHFVALPFPLLLCVPAFGIDLLRHWIGQGRGWVRDWLLAISAGLVFMALFLTTQWFFSRFLISPRAENWFFGADRYWGYGEHIGNWRNRFWSENNSAWDPPLTIKSFAVALLLGLGSSRIGLWAGNWMAQVRR
jgi:hypothetical protein